MHNEVSGKSANTSLRYGVWEQGFFTVPNGTPMDRVRAVQHIYMRKYGYCLEGQGFTVMKMTEPTLDLSMLGSVQGRQKYTMWAWCKRRPQTVHIDIPDNAVTEMQRAGMTLNE